MKHAYALAAALVLAVATPSSAQDQPSGPGKDAPPAAAPGTAPKAAPAPGAGAARPEKKERRVDAKAKDLLDGYAKQLATPSSAAEKSVSCRMEWDAAMLGGATVSMRPSWEKGGAYKCPVTLPEEVTQLFAPEQLDAMRGMFDLYTGLMTRAFIAGPVAAAEDYDVLYQEEQGKPVVLLMAWSDRAELQKQKVYIGEDGLAKRLVFQLRLDPSNPLAAQMAGVDVEVDLTHAKQDDRTVVSKTTVTMPIGVFSLEPKYAKGPRGTPLPVSVEIRNEAGATTEPARILDWVVDGKPVETTSSAPAAATSPKEPSAPSKDAQPADPAAPKDGGKSPAAPAK